MPSPPPATGLAPPGIGSNPSPYRYGDEGLPVPWWFNPKTALLYRDLDVYDDDVVLSSGVKMGTTWLSRLLVNLLYDEDDDDDDVVDETTTTAADDDDDDNSASSRLRRRRHPGRLGQTYPESTYPTRIEKANDEYGIYDRVPNGADVVDKMFGDYVWEDLVGMPRPRLFVSHLFGRAYLPSMLFDDDDDAGDADDGGGGGSRTRRRGKGRLIVLLRNLKDTMISLHNFRGTPLDGMHGNEHGPGSFRRFVDVGACPNSYGSAFRWIAESANALDEIGPDRSLVVYYEDLVLDFRGEVRRICDFLGLSPLSESRLRRVETACGIKNMRDDANFRLGDLCCRGGGIGGWKDVTELNDEEHWSALDRVFDDMLGGVKIAEPLRSYQTR
ncbi:hypothetical protein ACHAW5_004029 [Stephanodiscus triporus]|uniref:Sulfotransferase domain-containing protein n=1 Tax=Stephanodiscus triporus TaxID=2934178 RepID=A0ABD3NQK2_9STRA